MNISIRKISALWAGLPFANARLYRLKFFFYAPNANSSSAWEFGAYSLAKRILRSLSRFNFISLRFGRVCHSQTLAFIDYCFLDNTFHKTILYNTLLTVNFKNSKNMFKISCLVLKFCDIISLFLREIKGYEKS